MEAILSGSQERKNDLEPNAMNVKFPTGLLSYLLLGCIGCAAMAFSGCHKAPVTGRVASGEEAAGKEKPDAAEESEGVILKPEEVEKMGIVTAEAKAITHASETTGFAVVLAHENFASAVAELDTAAATERQSRAALERTQRLAGTAGAMPADTLESSQRQAAVDQAALALAQRKLSSLFGQNPPWKNQVNSPQLKALASGDAKLVRASFPLGATGDAAPKSLRLAHLNASPVGKSVGSYAVWNAPADAGVPGRSYFAYLKSGDFGEGERLLAWLPVGEAESGVLVPASAAVISGGKYWCYVEEKPGQFVRSELDPSLATNEGYFVKEGIEAGAKIVTVSAGQLLAREINPSTAAD
jgi:hypothetical protein